MIKHYDQNSSWKRKVLFHFIFYAYLSSKTCDQNFHFFIWKKKKALHFVEGHPAPCQGHLLSVITETSQILGSENLSLPSLGSLRCLWQRPFLLWIWVSSSEESHRMKRSFIQTILNFWTWPEVANDFQKKQCLNEWILYYCAKE